jgi:Fe-S oxidoreductase
MMREWLRLLSVNQQSGVSGKKPLDFLYNLLNKIQNSWHKKQGEYDFSHEVYESMACCLACKACATQCPVHVDVPEFRSKFLDLYHGRYLRPLKDYLVGSTESFGRLFPVAGKRITQLVGEPYVAEKSNWFKRFAGIQSRICQAASAEG